jgi:two-component system, NtrC family, C4-dicarboxylate transport response regulator DctD
MTRTVLVVDDDAAVREALAQTLELADLEPRVAASFIEAKDHIAADFDGVVLSDIRMPGRDGFFLLDHALKIDGELPVILLTGEGDIPMAVAAMNRGAFGFLEKPCASAELLPVVERALRTRALVLENRRLKAQLETGDPAARMIFGRSELSQALRRRIRQVAATGADVLVTGAPGAGISKVAEVIHLSSRTAQRPFVKRAAAGMDLSALEGAFQEAAGGSLYLNEVGQLSVEAQFALSERLESNSGTRLIAGTTAELEAAVAAGQFSPDLFYRLDVMRVHSPALKERPEDIPVMFRQYVAQAAEQAGLAAPEITPEVIAGLMARDWPGNARALMSEAMRFILGAGETGGEEGASDLGLVEQMAQIEKSLLAAALRRHEGRAAVVADALKLPRKTLYDKLAKYALKPDDFR